MAKIARKNQKIFGSTAGPQQLGVFGSLAEGLPAYSSDPETIQSLSAYLSGWFGAVLGNNSPAIEDMNSLCYLFAYQLAYAFQAGVPEWDDATTYYIGDKARSGRFIYSSIVDDNLNQAVTDTTKWALDGSRVRTTSTTGNITSVDDTVRATPSSDITLTLPAVGDVPVGWKVTVKNRSTNGSAVTVAGTIDGQTNLTLNSDPVFDSVTLQNNGTDYDII